MLNKEHSANVLHTMITLTNQDKYFGKFQKSCLHLETRSLWMLQAWEFEMSCARLYWYRIGYLITCKLKNRQMTPWIKDCTAIFMLSGNSVGKLTSKEWDLVWLHPILDTYRLHLSLHHCQLTAAVHRHKHILKDSIGLINPLEATPILPDQNIFLTLADIIAQHPLINIKYGMAALQWFMTEHTSIHEKPLQNYVPSQIWSWKQACRVQRPLETAKKTVFMIWLEIQIINAFASIQYCARDYWRHFADHARLPRTAKPLQCTFFNQPITL